MKLITYDDIIDLIYRLNLKGSGFLRSKLTLDPRARTCSSFNYEEKQTSNWWNIPAVRKRWNLKITGDPEMHWTEYVYKKYLHGKEDLKLLSPGSGVCASELQLAEYPVFKEIKCLDLAAKPIEYAQKIAAEKGLKVMQFVEGDVNKMDFPQDYYDIILFNSALHHFSNVEDLLLGKISKTLKHQGILIINEFTGPSRLQWKKSQLDAVNNILRENLPLQFKKRYKSDLIKKKVSGPGILRMIFSDPSEAVDSESIIPSLRKGFITLEEKSVGGNLLMILLKDISHHFEGEEPEATKILDFLFKEEDKFLENEISDNIFGIYVKK